MTITATSAKRPMNIAAIPDAAARAAAFTVAMLSAGLHVQEASTAETDDPEWLPWAAPCFCHRCNGAAPDAMSVAILAAEVIALHPELNGHGLAWDNVELEGLDFAARLVRIEPDERDPLYLIHEHICSEWWPHATGAERQSKMDRAGTDFMNLWEKAISIVQEFRPKIESLRKRLEIDGYVDGEEVISWWKSERTDSEITFL